MCAVPVMRLRSRLRWLALQPSGFHSEPYNELAKYYMDREKKRRR